MSEARHAILAALRASLADRPPVPNVPRRYRRAAPDGTDVLARFAERVADYRADVRTVSEEGIPSAVWSILARIRAHRVVVPAGVPDEWLVADGVERVADAPPLSSADLDGIDAVLTGCAIAVAETGTIVLDGGPDQGRRVLTLVPDHHLCVVRADQVVDDVPAAVAALDPRRPLTWISGPSATSDIELRRVEGVHGPRHLYVLLVTDRPGPASTRRGST
jgi:L-lactate dehydrogenase complex protein LldG